MSFGKLDNLINLIKPDIKEEIKNKKSLDLIKKELYIKYKDKLKELNFIEFSDIINRFVSNKIVFNNFNFKNGMKCFRDLDQKLKIDEINRKIKVPKEYEKLYQHFLNLYAIPQPEQRSPEWYEYRYSRITASDCASALDLNPYEPLEAFILKKCDPNFPFRDNDFVVHGKKYEQIATLMYEHIYNVKVTEFGCLPSNKYKFLGASPDGICSAHTLDGKFSEKLGTMLEIKCPYKRPITPKGEINGTICPNYYFWQIQQQLQCCELNDCDFWQCNIKEYKDRNEYLMDVDFNPIITEGTKGENVIMDKNLQKLIGKGCLIELYPNKFEKRWTKEEMIKELEPWQLKNNCIDDCEYYQGQYIYPPRLDMTIEEYDSWIINTLSTWKETFPELSKTHHFHRIIYWKIPNSHNVLIKRDDKLFERYLPVLKDTFSKIEYYRKHPEEIKQLKKECNRRRKFMYFINTKKIKTDYYISNNYLLKNKKLFLNDYNKIEYSEPKKDNDYNKEDKNMEPDFI